MPSLPFATTIIFLVSFCCFSSCTNSRQDVAAFIALNKSLEENNEILLHQIERSYHSLQRKLLDPKSVEKAKAIMPQVTIIFKSSTVFINYIDTIVADIREEANLENTSGRQVFDEANRTAARKIFTEQRLTVLKKKLAQFRSEMFGIDTFASSQLSSIIDDILTEENKTIDHFSSGGLPAIGAVSMLTRLKNKVRIVQQLLIHFCDSRISNHDDNYYTEFYALATLSSKYVKPGEEVEVNAGIGAFSLKAKPKIILNGNNIPVNTQGIAVYKFKAPKKPGKYFITSVIEFSGYDTTRQSIRKTLQYIVLE
jgi:hypothetical protein